MIDGAGGDAMEPNHTVEHLTNGLSICVNSEHSFGTDAFLLSDFAAPRVKERACDLGTGCGIVPLLWFRANPPKLAYAVELQKNAAPLLRQTVAQNGLEGRLIPLTADLRALAGVLPAGQFDLVTCNPPYKKSGAGILSARPSERIARHEVACTIADVCASAARLLRFGGRLCLCQRPERLLDTLESMRAHGIEPKRLRLVQQRADTPAWLFLAEGKRGAKPFLQVEAPLIVAGDGRDGFSAELLAIYGGNKQ